MKYLGVIRITILTLLLSALNFKASGQEKFTVNGEVSGLNDGVVYTYLEKGVDSIQIKNGKFVFESSSDEPLISFYLMKKNELAMGSKKERVTLYLEPGVMNLKFDYTDFSKSKLTGSKTQSDNDKYNSIIDGIVKKYKKQNDNYDALNKKYMDAVAAKKSEAELQKLKYAAYDAKDLLEPQYKEMGEASLKFIKENPKSYISLQNLLFNLRGLNYDQAIGYYKTFDPKYTGTKTGKYLLAEIEKMKKGVPGAAAGPFNTKDINGNALKLEDFKGKYVLIDFWASWCVPCRKGNPHLLKLYAAYKPKGLEILGVSDDDRNHDAWKKAVEKDGIGVWRHVLRGLQYKEGTYEKINADQDISEGYNIHVLPTKILVDPNGIVVARYDGGEADDKKMDDDLAAIFKTK